MYVAFVLIFDFSQGKFQKEKLLGEKEHGYFKNSLVVRSAKLPLIFPLVVSESVHISIHLLTVIF